jgi:hypothetical protein
MSFDPMAAAVDWLDAYRAGEIDLILEMYADNAIVRCGCDGNKIITGKEALRAYWMHRLRNYPASDLDDLQPSDNGTMISYIASKGVVNAVLTFDDNGRIALLTCGPSN